VRAFAHLSDEAQQVVDGSPQERIDFVNRLHWVDYPAATKVLESVDLLGKYGHFRTDNLVLAAVSQNGKSFLLAHAREAMQREDPPRRVLRVSAPQKLPGLDALQRTILAALSPGFAAGRGIRFDPREIERQLKAYSIQMLVLDDYELGRRSKAQWGYLMGLKSLCNVLSVPTVVLATIENAEKLFRESELITRFQSLTLSSWEWGEDYVRWLSGLERFLPFEQPSHLAAEDVAGRILQSSDKTIGSLAGLVRRAAVEAIKAGRPCIDVSVFA
jgi:hypothetical protein